MNKSNFKFMSYNHLKILLQMIFYLSTFTSWGQSDTLTFLYDKNWKRIFSQKEAEYFGKAYENEIGYWDVVDYYKDGNIQMKGTYLDTTFQIKQGNFDWFHENGRKKTTASYWNNRLVGDYYEYYENGQLDTYIQYGNYGQIIESKYYKIDGSLSIMELPVFQGNTEKSLAIFFNQNLKYPRTARKKNIVGKVIVRFEINIDGSLRNYEVLSSPAPSLSEEALRVIKLMPKWKPANRDGDLIPMIFNLPVSFTLD